MSQSREQLRSWIDQHTVSGAGEQILKNDCEIILYLMENCALEIPAGNRFFGKVNCTWLPNAVPPKREKSIHALPEIAAFQDGVDALAYTGGSDFSHTSAEWESVVRLGIFGLRNRIAEYAQRNGVSEKSKIFYEQELRVYDAALRFMRRAADIAAACGRTEMAESLIRLTGDSPANLYEALQTSIVYYFLQHIFGGTSLRTLGRVDHMFYPYYVREDKATADALLLDYVKEIDLLDAPSNIPFALGGTDADGNDQINEMSYVWLDAYDKAHTKNTKLHLLCSAHTPDDIIQQAFCSIRAGNNSIVFLSDSRVIESLIQQGIEPQDAVRYHVVGCYECGGEGEITCSCNARVNVPKALELALNGGRDMITGKQIGLENDGDFASFAELNAEFERQLAHLCRCAMQLTNLYESHYAQLHAAPFLSGTYTSALEKGGDIYLDYAAKYNSSSLNAVGLATATDSLAAIRKAVFEEKMVTLRELAEILRTNWKDQEVLRLTVKNKYPKFGQGDEKTDAIAARIVDVLAEAVRGKPNAKGGKWRLGLFSINWRWEFGEKTAASADGRRSGETVSQNTSASVGADTAGATAHLLSVARLDTTKTPNGTIVDIDLHSSAVRGENGIAALTASLKTYFALGGFAVQYNVLDTELLRDAKRNPEKYPNLQVRLCGWNVLFSSLSETEKDEFIARSMR